jgi:hypothetical protein
MRSRSTCSYSRIQGCGMEHGCQINWSQGCGVKRICLPCMYASLGPRVVGERHKHGQAGLRIGRMHIPVQRLGQGEFGPRIMGWSRDGCMKMPHPGARDGAQVTSSGPRVGNVGAFHVICGGGGGLCRPRHLCAGLVVWCAPFQALPNSTKELSVMGQVIWS